MAESKVLPETSGVKVLPEGDPPPASTATYIIICSGRTEVFLAIGEVSLQARLARQIAAASNCAAQLVAYLQSFHAGAGGLKPERFSAVTRCQHELMDLAKTYATGTALKRAPVEAKVAEMFQHLADLEKQFPGL